LRKPFFSAVQVLNHVKFITLNIQLCANEMIRSILIVFVLMLFIVPSIDASLYGESVDFDDLHDQRTFSLSPDYDPDQSQGGLSGYWPYSFVISWDITYDTTVLKWHYEYNLSVSDKAISHFILEVSDTAQDNDIENVFINGSTASVEGPNTWTKAGNQTMPNPFYGIKFDDGGESASYSFDTTLNPVWGNYYAKGGNDHGNLVNAYNNALEDSNFNSDNNLDFIVRPNGGNTPPVAPEPFSSTLFIVGGATLGFRRFRKKIKSI
jgi:hypothetical protein